MSNQVFNYMVLLFLVIVGFCTFMVTFFMLDGCFRIVIQQTHVVPHPYFWIMELIGFSGISLWLSGKVIRFLDKAYKAGASS